MVQTVHGSPSSGAMRRCTLSLSPADHAKLVDMAASVGPTRSETIRAAIAVVSFQVTAPRMVVVADDEQISVAETRVPRVRRTPHLRVAD